MAGSNAITIDVGRANQDIIIRPRGACTVLACDTIQRFLRRGGGAGISTIWFDLSDAPALDSTFAGLLLELRKKSQIAAAPALRLLNPTQSVREALERMHVLRLFEVQDDRTLAPAEWLSLPSEPAEVEDLAQCVLAAHEALIEADERNRPIFKPVVDGLKQSRAANRSY